MEFSLGGDREGAWSPFILLSLADPDDPGDDGVQLLPVTKFLSTPDLEGDTLLSGQ